MVRSDSSALDNWLLNINFYKASLIVQDKRAGYNRPVEIQIYTDIRVYKRIYNKLFFFPMLGYANESYYARVYASHDNWNMITYGAGIQYSHRLFGKNTELAGGGSVNRFDFWSYIKNGSSISKDRTKGIFEQLDVFLYNKLSKKVRLSIGLTLRHQLKSNRFLNSDIQTGINIGALYNLN